MVRIDSYSQYFTVTSSNYSKLIHTLYDFNKSLITYRMALTRVKGQSKPKVITKPDKYFYVAETRDIGYAVKKDVIRYPITLLGSLITFLEDRGVDKETIEVEHHEPMKGRKVEISLNPEYKPRDYQTVYIDKIAELDRHNVLIDLMTGLGKALHCNTPIKIKHGWKRIGDVRKGEKVIGRDGLETTVTGVYPQGMKQLYKVTFADGRSVDADLEHLWTVHSYNFIKRSNNAYKYCNYVIKPYLFGLMLGTKQMDADITLPKLNDHIISRVKANMSDLHYLNVDNNTLHIVHKNPKIKRHSINRQLGILRIDTTDNLFIPSRYKSGLPKQRKDLIDGLVDGAGVRNDKYAKISCSTFDYARDIYGIIISLNGKATVSRDHEANAFFVYIDLTSIKDINSGLPKLTNIHTIGEEMTSKVMNTEEIMKYLETKKNTKETISRYYIDLPTPSDFEPLAFKIHPYVLGVMLGDGRMKSLTIANVSDHILTRITAVIGDGYIVKRYDDYVIVIRYADPKNKPHIDIRETLKELGLFHTRAWEKFIPKDYLEGSLEQRLELLRGLMDTDGEVGEDGTPSYSTTSERLANDVQLLVRSLGGMCNINTRYTHYTYKGVKKRGRLSYRLNIRIKNPKDIVTLPKRRDRLKDVNQYGHNLKLRITSVEKSIKDEAVCISVDNGDKLYIVKDYIVTHNTFIAMASMSRIKKAFSMIVLPRYIDKWIGDVITLTDIQEHEILVIKGMSNLTSILNDPVIAKNYKCFIISLTTLNYFIKKYNTGELLEYTTKGPEDLFKALGTEIVLNDETHQEFHNVYRNMLYANIKMFVGITATLVSKDPDVTRMHDIMFPEENRISNIVKAEPYIYITSVRFRFMYKKQIRFKNHFGYNQAMFENSIMKNSVITHNYLKMIYGLLRGFYDKKRTEGDKAIVFMGTVNMCNLMVDYIKSKSNLKITKYTEEDDYSVIEESDIIISTLASASTALDIPNLITTIQTVNVDSTAANLQTLGRLRNIKGKRMDFVYIWTSDIRQHKTYNYNRLKLFVKRAKHIRSIEYRELV